MKKVLKSDRFYMATMGEGCPALVKKYGTGIEIDHFCSAENMEGERFAGTKEEVDRALAQADTPERIIHAPFNELFPAAIDPRALALARLRYEQAYRIACHYNAKSMVVHSGYVPFVYFKEYHISRSVEFWREFMKDKPEDFTLLIENVLEDEPFTMAQLMAELREGEKNPAKKNRYRACLDIGHRNITSSMSAVKWIEALAPYLGHAHLHNNDGKGDYHWCLHRGNMDMEEIMDAFLSMAPEDMTYGVECIEPEPSMEWLLRKGYIAE